MINKSSNETHCCREKQKINICKTCNSIVELLYHFSLLYLHFNLNIFKSPKCSFVPTVEEQSSGLWLDAFYAKSIIL